MHFIRRDNINLWCVIRNHTMLGINQKIKRKHETHTKKYKKKPLKKI